MPNTERKSRSMMFMSDKIRIPNDIYKNKLHKKYIRSKNLKFLVVRNIFIF